MQLPSTSQIPVSTDALAKMTLHVVKQSQTDQDLEYSYTAKCSGKLNTLQVITSHQLCPDFFFNNTYNSAVLTENSCYRHFCPINNIYDNIYESEQITILKKKLVSG